MKRIIRYGLLAGTLLMVAGCGEYEEEEREIGHRGEARIDPYLAGRRFLEELGYEVRRERSWPELGGEDAMLLMPAAMIEGRGTVDQLRRWVSAGGHLVCLFDGASAARNDWGSMWLQDPPPPEALIEWVESLGMEYDSEVEEPGDSELADGATWMVEGPEEFRIEQAGLPRFVWDPGDEETGESFVSMYIGAGRLTLVADARPLRNRYIGEADHALLLAALARASRPGAVVFVVGSGVSFWAMLWRTGWPVIVALLLVVVIWLWRTLPRFGPLKVETRIDDWRDYRRHLEAVGGFLWSHDRGQSLLEPLRREVQDRLQRRRAAAGAQAEDIFKLAESISGVPAERVRRALGGVGKPDPASFTRMTSDLQQLLQSL